MFAIVGVRLEWLWTSKIAISRTSLVQPSFSEHCRWNCRKPRPLHDEREQTPHVRRLVVTSKWGWEETFLYSTPTPPCWDTHFAGFHGICQLLAKQRMQMAPVTDQRWERKLSKLLLTLANSLWFLTSQALGVFQIFHTDVGQHCLKANTVDQNIQELLILLFRLWGDAQANNLEGKYNLSQPRRLVNRAAQCSKQVRTIVKLYTNQLHSTFTVHKDKWLGVKIPSQFNFACLKKLLHIRSQK